jgi:hypothetical protein
MPTHRIALAAALVALARVASAEPPCAADARRFCDGRPPAELTSCLQAHRADLAAACVDRIERVLVFFQSAATACKLDAYESCPATAPGLPMLDCLRARGEKLTPACRQFFDAMLARDASVQRACANEAARACPGVSPGRGELWMCLGLGAVDVSEACAKAL